ncbi:MAG: hypothetical protein JJE17_07795 [Peptostreptococcaceae bacterium]|nr:hypothetical protein [Peptostreptococcaceae bacterium]
MTKTQQLAEKLKEIAFAHKDEIEELSTTDERGRENAAFIDGWIRIGNGTITKACKLGGVHTMTWDYETPDFYPVEALPRCIFAEAYSAYNKIFPTRRNDSQKEDSLILPNLVHDKDWGR